MPSSYSDCRFDCDKIGTINGVCDSIDGYCKCRDGFKSNLECRPTLDLGLSDQQNIPNDAIMVSGEEEGYPKERIRLNSDLGWCGNSDVTDTSNPGNWVVIDLKAPTVIKGFRTQGK